MVYLMKETGDRLHTAVLFLTDTDLSVLKIYSLYKACFQIEFLFWNAKQFMVGLILPAEGPGLPCSVQIPRMGVTVQSPL